MVTRTFSFRKLIIYLNLLITERDWQSGETLLFTLCSSALWNQFNDYIYIYIYVLVYWSTVLSLYPMMRRLVFTVNVVKCGIHRAPRLTIGLVDGIDLFLFL